MELCILFSILLSHFSFSECDIYCVQIGYSILTLFFIGGDLVGSRLNHSTQFMSTLGFQDVYQLITKLVNSERNVGAFFIMFEPTTTQRSINVLFRYMVHISKIIIDRNLKMRLNSLIELDNVGNL